MDAIVVLDDELRIALMNPASLRIFGQVDAPIGQDFRSWLEADAPRRLADCAAELTHPARESSSLWIGGGLQAKRPQGRSFQAEATLSRYRADERYWFTLILRDVDERPINREPPRSVEL